MDFDLSKENIQPLRGGRNISQLEVALQAQSDTEMQRELIRQKEAFEEAIRTYAGDDPLNNWYSFISWVEQSYPKHGHEGNLMNLLETCLEKFEHDQRYMHDRRLCKLWIKYIDLQQNPLELIQILHSQGICTNCADLYRAWAYFHEAAGDFKRADTVFRIGLRNLAQPYEDLVLAHENMFIAAGKHTVQDIDENRLMEERRALTSLRTYQHNHRAVVGNLRTGNQMKNAMPGMLQQPSKAIEANTKVTCFEDEHQAGPSVGIGASRMSVLDVARKQDKSHKENTLKPGPWTTVQSKRSAAACGSQHRTPAFRVHEDNEEGPPEYPDKIILPPNFVCMNHDDFSDWKLDLFFPEPPDDTKVACYPKHLVYASKTEEFSFEEIRARKWFEKKRAQKNDSNVMQETIIHESTGALASNDYCMETEQTRFMMPPNPNNFVFPSPVVSQPEFAQPVEPVKSFNHFPLQNNYVLPKLPQTPIYPNERNFPEHSPNLELPPMHSGLPPAPQNLGFVAQTGKVSEDHFGMILNYGQLSHNVELNSLKLNVHDFPPQNSLPMQMEGPKTLLHPAETNLDGSKNQMSLQNEAANFPVKDLIHSKPVHEENAEAQIKPFLERTYPYKELNETNADESYTVNFQEVMKDVNDLWKNSQTFLQESRVEIPVAKKVPTFEVFEDTSVGRDESKQSVPENIGKSDFAIYSDSPNPKNKYALEPRIDVKKRALHDSVLPTISQPEQTGNARQSYSQPEHTRVSCYQPRKSVSQSEDPLKTFKAPEMCPFNETCTTQTFNFNLDSQKSSTPFNHKKTVTQQMPEASIFEDNSGHKSNKKKLFSDEEICEENDNKLSIILETTKEYRFTSSNSSGSTTPKSTFLKVVPDNMENSRENQEFLSFPNKYQNQSDTQNKLYKEYLKYINPMNIEQHFNMSPEKYHDGESNDSLHESPMKSTKMDVDPKVDLKMDTDSLNPLNKFDETLLQKIPSNPFTKSLTDALLCKIGFPNPKHQSSYVVLQNMPRIAMRKEAICLGDERYVIDKILGKGTYGSVFKATKLSTGEAIAMKYQKSANSWEYYICKEIQGRIANTHLLKAYLDVSIGFFSKTSNLLITEFCKYGSLLDVSNKVKQISGRGLKELVSIYFANEIVTIVNALHKCQIIHADIKPDNFLVTRIPPEFGHTSLKLIDFGCSIDMSLFPVGTSFTTVISTEDFVCTEMKEGKPWTYQTDLYCMAATVHVLLFEKYMQVIKRGDVWSITQRVPRYMRTDLWNTFFFQLLNIEGCDKLPDLLLLKSSFDSILSSCNEELQIEMRYMANSILGR